MLIYMDVDFLYNGDCICQFILMKICKIVVFCFTFGDFTSLLYIFNNHYFEYVLPVYILNAYVYVYGFCSK